MRFRGGGEDMEVGEVPSQQVERPASGKAPSTARVERFDSAQAKLWNDFVARSKNGTFLFDRNYMDYHADRFVDHSLMVWQGDRLIAMLPANERDGALYSHGGLTFGGFVTDERMTAGAMLETFTALLDYAARHGCRRIVYKPAPHIYHGVPAEEDLYALVRCHARLVRRDISSTINMTQRIDMTKGRKWAANKARKAGIAVRPSDQFEMFMELEAEHLALKYGVKPTHTPAEMRLLANRFPNNIRLFAAYEGPTLLGGTVVYESGNVAHTQYIASTDRGRELAALDAVMDHLLSDVYANKCYFDFGISTEDGGRYLNLGLIANKESYGARATATDWYELDVAEAA